ncbi:class I SAM-dependent rRNA methyltransferase [Evansella sp. AB-P1]|uniref:class I SAM-dependent rRNA methyltransferase n=1 Tax=Evansella sp. AB-P1 TaxID=3037653 RepID=UPI00241D93E2|nr:class I SAM-dependent rRNA methyltransferase [Evansella sp. AB-P1]MDG5790044.1 class I SAM-dependent rRNA methyltransferase [Evansella sp. AB-P1]
MEKEVSLMVKPNVEKKYKGGYPLILKEAIMNLSDVKEEGTLIQLVDQRNSFIGRGYYGRQNKGYGWILTNKEKEIINESFFEKKLSTALQKRTVLFEDNQTTAFRLFNGEGDGIGGLTIDYYDGYFVISWYSEGIYRFKEPIIHSLQRLVEYKAIYQKKRFDTGGKYIEEDDFVTGVRGEFPILVKENGVNFSVYLNEGPMTGVFLDQREVRKTIREKYAKGKTVLNTFSYTGAFSVYAVLGGAKKTTSVDLANRSLAKTEEQFQVNNIDPAKQEIKVMDVFNYFNYAVKRNIKFDMVILDPPSFARSKKRTFSAAKDYKNLLKDAISITNENGMIVASTNYSGFGMEKFKGFIEKAFEEMGERFDIIEQFSLPEDFPYHHAFKEGNYLKVVFIKKRSKS